MKTLITYYEIELSTYHGTPQCRVQYVHDNQVIRSNLYSPAETTNLLALWRTDKLAGSFGIGTRLAPDATFILFERN